MTSPLRLLLLAATKKGICAVRIGDSYKDLVYKLKNDVKATACQRKVWDHLRTIPEGQTVHYRELASAIGQPKATRAVARACATNPVAIVIPGHRVVPKTGGVGGYRWGSERKKKLLAMEKKDG